MIATIRAEWRKNRFRPAFLVGFGLIAAITILVFSGNWYQALHPGAIDKPVQLASLYADQFVNNVMGAGFPLGAAMSIVLGALLAGSEYSWATLKTVLTQGPGRLTTLAGRVIVFGVWMGILTLVLFAIGAAYSAVITSVEGHTIVWPPFSEIAKGFGAVWLIFGVFGSIGLALGVLIRQSAAALGVGLVYLLSVEILVVRFIDTISNGAYKWIGDLFVGQNALALIGHISGKTNGIAISTEQALLVMSAWLIGLLVVAAVLQRMRDVT